MSGGGLPREIRHMPVDERRGLPIPFIVEWLDGVPNFGVLDPKRAVVCYANRLCAMCGLKMGAEVALYGDVVSLEPEGFYIEAPTHERCMMLAIGGLCPFISSETYPRRRQDDPEVAVLGDREKMREVGRTIAKRPGIVAIANDYEMALMVTDNGNMPVYLAPRVVRVHRFAWVGGMAREQLDEPLVEPPRYIRSQPRRLTRSGRRK